MVHLLSKNSPVNSKSVATESTSVDENSVPQTMKIINSYLSQEN